jgi:hypothetical protein
MKITRGLFRLWVIASLIWILMWATGLWSGMSSPFPKLSYPDYLWERMTWTFEMETYVYTPEGRPKPEGTAAKKSGPGTLDDSSGRIKSMIVTYRRTIRSKYTG